MLIEKSNDCWFVDCDGTMCNAHLLYAYVNKQSALYDIAEANWEIHEGNMCYCPKCVRKMNKNG